MTRNIAKICSLIGAILFLLLLYPCGGGSSLHAQQRIIELQIKADSRAAVGTQQRWMEVLQDVGANRVVVKTGTSSTPEIEEVQLSSSTLITITGSINRNKLILPGGSFSIRDKAAIRELIQRLRDDGVKVALAEKKAFGLTSEQLVEQHRELSKPLDFETQGESAEQVVSKISRLIGKPLSIDTAAAAALRKGGQVAEELKGVAAGSALAVVLRPLGLVLEPGRQQGREIELKIVDYRESQENWPIGWPIQTTPVSAEPRLFERLQLEIRGFPLADAMSAIEKRTGVPFFYDHNSFARHGVDISQTKVTLVQDKASFMVAIDKLLRQSKPKLKYELRQDENGKSFLWITTQ